MVKRTYKLLYRLTTFAHSFTIRNLISRRQLKVFSSNIYVEWSKSWLMSLSGIYPPDRILSYGNKSSCTCHVSLNCTTVHGNRLIPSWHLPIITLTGIINPILNTSHEIYERGSNGNNIKTLGTKSFIMVFKILYDEKIMMNAEDKSLWHPQIQ